jgi:hypothetical protein
VIVQFGDGVHGWMIPVSDVQHMAWHCGDAKAA